MLKKMLSMKRTTKGAISIFLILIFLQSYLFAAVLVDGGRYQMANVMAETALDSATDSVLTYYNQLLYDLYGIFALDCSDISGGSEEELNRAIRDKMDNYLKHTLSIIDVDYSHYSNIFGDLLRNGIDASVEDYGGVVGDAIKESISEENMTKVEEKLPDTLNNILGFGKEEESQKYLNLFNFTLEKDIEGGASVTLANTDYVEDQIIDYMKFRAPLDLVNERTGFIGKIQQLLNLTKYMEFAKKKVSLLKKDKVKNAYEKAEELTEELKEFRNKVAWVLEFNSNTSEKGKSYIIESDVSELSEEIKTIALEKAKEKVPITIKKAYEEEYEGAVPICDWIINMKIEKNNEIGALNNILEEKSKKISEVILDDVENQVKKIRKLEGQMENILEQISSLTGKSITDIENLDSENLDSEKLKEVIENCQSELGQKIANISLDIFYDELDLEPLEEDYNEIYEKIWEIEEKIFVKEENEEDTSELENAKVELEEELSSLESEINTLSQEIAGQEEEITSLQGKINKLESYGNDLDKIDVIIATIITECKKEVTAQLHTIRDNFWTILEKAKSYEKKFKEVKAEIEAHMKELQTLQDEQTEELKQAGASCEADINLVKSSLGTLISTYAYVDAIIESYPKLEKKEDLWETEFEVLLSDVEDELKNARENFSKEQPGLFKWNIATLAVEQGAMLFLASESSEKKDKEEIKVKDTDKIKENTEEQYKKEQEKKERKEGKDLVVDENDKILTINYTSGDINEGEELNLDVEENEEAFLEVGTMLLEFLDKLGENIRDSIFVNQYVISHFPNAVHERYYEKENSLQKKRLESYKLETNQAIAEVEYIITGEAEYDEAVKDIKAQLLLIRTAFNLVSAMMSPTMYQQALSLSAWAGVGAPAVAMAILFAWTIAESTIDIIKLYEEEDVLVFKDSSKWTLSLAGAMGQIFAIGTEIVLHQATSLYDKAKECVNIAIFENYNNLKQKGKNALEDSFDSFAGLIGGYKENLGKNAEEEILEETKFFQETVGEIGTIVSSYASDKLYENVTTMTDSVLFQSVTTMNAKADAAVEAIEEKVSEFSKKAQKTASDAVNEALTGTAVGASNVTKGKISLDITMNYEEYLNLFLLFTNQKTKVQRIQSVIQLNMNSLQKGFSMERSAVAVWADAEVSIDFKFMPDSLIPAAFRSDGKGKMVFKIHSARSY